MFHLLVIILIRDFFYDKHFHGEWISGHTSFLNDFKYPMYSFGHYYYHHPLFFEMSFYALYLWLRWWDLCHFFLIHLKELLIYLDYLAEISKLSTPQLNSSRLKLQATIDHNGIWWWIMRQNIIQCWADFYIFKLAKTYGAHSRTTKEEHSWRTSQIGQRLI